MAEEAKPTPSVQLITTYIKDVSFENIGLQNNYVAKKQPKFEMNLNINNKVVEGDIVEVSLNVKIKAEEGDQTIFMMDLEHAGRFILKDVVDDQRVPFLYIECPRLLFPYTRRIISGMTLDGGLMPLNLDHIDFVKMFQNSVEAARAKAAEKN